MTSDRGNSGGAELQLTTPSVTQKSPGLNPNATVFLSKQDIHHWDELNAEGSYQFANGDINKLETGSGVFSPAAAAAAPPESPLQATSAEFTVAPGTLTTSPAAPPPPAADQTVANPGPAAGGGSGGGTGSETIIGTTGIATTTNPIIYSTPTETATLQDDNTAQVDGTLSDEQIRRMLKTQLEYYFSRENLTSDTYLMSQMDADQYVAISAVANFSQVQRLTNNHDLVVDVLRECQNVQVDDKGEKVRPNHNRCIVILREIPASTPVEEVENLFSGSNCPKFVSCEFAHNDSWYVTFDSDEDAQRAYQYLREEVKSFLGKSIMARIKAKPLIRSTYVPRNGLKPQYEQQAYSSTQRYAFLPNIPYTQQLFYHPSHAVLSSWPTAGPAIMDPSMVFAMNGYQATSVKLNTTGRHQFPNMRVSRTTKPHRLNQERASSDSRLPHDRHQNPNAHRSSPRSTENTHVPSPLFSNRKCGENSSHHSHLVHHHHIHPSTSGGSGTTTAAAVHHSSANAADSSSSMTVSHLSDSNKDSPAPQPQRKLYKNRRKREEDNSKLSRQSSSQLSANNKYTEPLFEFESNSFPPLPGSQNNAASGEKFENKLSDVVRGTAKTLVKESVIAAPLVATASSSSITHTSNTAVVTPMAAGEVGLPNQLPPQSPVSKDVSTSVSAPMLTPVSAVTSSATLAAVSAVTSAQPLSTSISSNSSSSCILTTPAATAISQPVSPSKPASVIASAASKLSSGIHAENTKSTEPLTASSLQSAGSVSHPITTCAAASTTLTTAATASPKEVSVGAVSPALPAHNTPSNSSPLSASLPPSSSSSSSLSSTSIGHSMQVSAAQQNHHRAMQSSAMNPAQVMTTSAAATSSGSLSAGNVTNAITTVTSSQNTKHLTTEEKSTSRLSYAQMVARKREPSSEAPATSISSSDKSQTSTPQQQVSQQQLSQQQQVSQHDPMCKTANNSLIQQGGSAGTLRSQALKEQSQALKVSPPSSAHSQLIPPKEQLMRKDLEPKEQRFVGGRRPAKENRERQRRKTDRERTSK